MLYQLDDCSIPRKPTYHSLYGFSESIEPSITLPIPEILGISRLKWKLHLYLLSCFRKNRVSRVTDQN